MQGPERSTVAALSYKAAIIDCVVVVWLRMRAFSADLPYYLLCTPVESAADCLKAYELKLDLAMGDIYSKEDTSTRRLSLRLMTSGVREALFIT